MGNYKFDLDSKAKNINVLIGGFFTKEDGSGYIAEYKKCVNEIKPDEYDLRLDCTDLAVTQADILPMLEDCIKMYDKDGFKRVITKIKKDNVILKMQIQRLINNTKTSKIELVLE